MDDVKKFRDELIGSLDDWPLDDPKTVLDDCTDCGRRRPVWKMALFLGVPPLTAERPAATVNMAVVHLCRPCHRRRESQRY